MFIIAHLFLFPELYFMELEYIVNNIVEPVRKSEIPFSMATIKVDRREGQGAHICRY